MVEAACQLNYNFFVTSLVLNRTINARYITL